MITRLSNEFADQYLNEMAWDELSSNYQWTEETLEKYKDKLDWTNVSRNRNIQWTTSMLDRFKERLDWDEMSSKTNHLLLSAENLEKFKDYWDWRSVSGNRAVHLSYELIDRFIDLWNWSVLIERDNESLFSEQFYEKYIDRIPLNILINSELIRVIAIKRQIELSYTITSETESA